MASLRGIQSGCSQMALVLPHLPPRSSMCPKRTKNNYTAVTTGLNDLLCLASELLSSGNVMVLWDNSCTEAIVTLEVDVTRTAGGGCFIQGRCKMKHWFEGHCTYLHVKATTTGSDRYVCAHRGQSCQLRMCLAGNGLCNPPALPCFESSLPVKTHVAFLLKEGRHD